MKVSRFIIPVNPRMNLNRPILGQNILAAPYNAKHQLTRPPPPLKSPERRSLGFFLRAKQCLIRLGGTYLRDEIDRLLFCFPELGVY